MFGSKKHAHSTATTTDFQNSLMGKLVLYLGDLANPKNGLNLTNPLCCERYHILKKETRTY
jgi:hypothetical protein